MSKHSCSDFFVDKVKCDTCKHWIDKEDAQNVWHYGAYIIGRIDNWYCPEHKKPYTHYFFGNPTSLYFGEVSMSEDGTPTGYIKKPKKKKET